MQKTYKVYKITFEDGFAYVGITKYSVPDRIRRHLQRPVNTEVSRRLRKEVPYVYTVLFDDIKDYSEAYRLESQEIFKLEKPINISGANPEKRQQFGNPMALDNILRRFRTRTQRNVYPPRKGRYACSICRVRKAHTEFNRDRTRFNGLDSRCRDCTVLRGKAHRENKGLRDPKNPLVCQQPWTDADIETLKRLTKKGKSTKEIAEEMGGVRTPGAINTKRWNLGIVSQKKRHWSPDEVARLQALWSADTPIGEIAKKLGRSYASISGKLRKMGVGKP